jgi:hypothetical protein
MRKNVEYYQTLKEGLKEFKAKIDINLDLSRFAYN